MCLNAKLSLFICFLRAASPINCAPHTTSYHPRNESPFIEPLCPSRKTLMTLTTLTFIAARKRNYFSIETMNCARDFAAPDLGQVTYDDDA